jgi:hypothetical protein
MVTIALLLTKSGRDAGGSGQQFPRYSTCQASHPVRCGQQVPGTFAPGITPRSFEVGWPECVWHRWIPERSRDPVKGGSDDRDDIEIGAKGRNVFHFGSIQEQGQATDVESIVQANASNQRLLILCSEVAVLQEPQGARCTSHGTARSSNKGPAPPKFDCRFMNKCRLLAAEREEEYGSSLGRRCCKRTCNGRMCTFRNVLSVC